ncbi:uncharacterized protein J3D65DRAFT_432305 [Phyllosticta citribraziliensis]|uniref:Uncharacterized protein n=1 Tax=Phyllosticta citribraziliensis TaxID=989973 RepID=A0ABR1LIF3_9PEZI
MDVHSLHRLKDACAHYLSIFYATILQWLAIIHHWLQESLLSDRLQSLVTLVKINLLQPLVFEIDREFSPQSWLDPLKQKAANAFEFLTTSGDHLLNHIPAPAWPSLGPFRDAASSQFESLVTAFRVYFDKLRGSALARPRYLLRSAARKSHLIQTGIFENDHHLKKRFNATFIIQSLDVGGYHIEDVTKTGISSFNTAKDAFSAHLSRTCNAVSHFCGVFLRIAAAGVPLVVRFFRALLDSVGALIESSETHITSLLALCKIWISSCFKIFASGGEVILTNRRLLLQSAVFILASLLVCLLVTLVPWYNLAKKLHFKLRLRDPRISRQQSRATLKSLALSTIRHTVSFVQSVVKVFAVVFTALKYFVCTPVDTLILLGFVTAYVLLDPFRIIGRFSLLDELWLSMKLGNNMPGAWVTHMDQQPRKGLFRSTLQLEAPPAPVTFSSLPRTIRSRIYELALTDHHGFKWDNRMKTLRSNLSPSLLRVSYDTRRSTLPIPFNMNKIVIDTSSKELQLAVPPELQRHLLPQDQPCGREQLLDLLTSLRIPHASSPPTSPTHTCSSSSSSAGADDDTDEDTDVSSPRPKQPLPHIGRLLRTGATPWVVEIREPYTRVWSFDIAAIVAHLPLAPSLIVNYTITIPPGPPHPLSRAQRLASQLTTAAYLGSTDRRFHVYIEGLEHWEDLVANSILGMGGVEDAHGFLAEGPTDLRREVTRVVRAVEKMNAH